MNGMSERFSERYGFEEVKQAEITVKHDAPEKLRAVLPVIAEDVGLTPKPLRKLVCRVLLEQPNPDNWSEYPNIEYEVQELLESCEWYEVYNIIEEIANQGHWDKADRFEERINRFFEQNGIGWKLKDGQLVIRGPEAFESTVAAARQTLLETGRDTATKEIHKALEDLSRRPEPDITGAIQHAMSALECVTRDVIGDNGTLGKLLQRNPGLFPAPLNKAVEMLWGFASEHGRHLRESREPEQTEAELIVGLASVLATYLSKKSN